MLRWPLRALLTALGLLGLGSGALGATCALAAACIHIDGTPAPSPVVSVVSLSAPAGSGRARGVLTIAGKPRGFVLEGSGVLGGDGQTYTVRASGLPPSSSPAFMPRGTSGFAYGLWLYSSASHTLFDGYFSRVAAGGSLLGTSPVPIGASAYRFLIVTREPAVVSWHRAPTHPGPIVLMGPLRLSGTRNGR